MLFYLFTFLSKLFAQLAESSFKPADAQPAPSQPLSASEKALEALWLSQSLDMTHIVEIQHAAQVIIGNQARYEKVGKPFGIPYYIIGCLHMRESDFNFDLHLANGDPLFDSRGKPQKTKHVPIGLGPFADWESSALAALVHEGWDKLSDWRLPAALDHLERYNGLGYRNRGLNSPYLWSMSNHGVGVGKYASDGVYDSGLVDKQIGCAAVLYQLNQQGILV